MAYELLRTYIRQQLLQEGRKWVGDIAPMHKVLIEYSGDDYIDISVVHQDADNGLEGPEEGDGDYMHMEIVRWPQYNKNCLNGWMVLGSAAANSWGPLLYDIAMEWATQHGGGLFADRSSVSKEAYNIWSYYMNNRSDVEVIQLDDENDSFENGPEDDCAQETTKIWANKTNRPNWTDDPLSKLYRKKVPESLEHLKKLGKLIVRK